MKGGFQMAGLTAEEKAEIEKRFEDLKEPVTILLHKPQGKAELVEDFVPVLEELCSISDKLTYKGMVEMETDEDIIHDVEMFPSLVLLDKDEKDYGIRFYGVPTSRFFQSFIRTIILLSSGEHGLEDEVKARIEGIEENKMTVLATPSVPKLDSYLNDLVSMAYMSDKIECAAVDLIQFPHIAERHHVLDMPRTISNEDLKFTGVYSVEDIFEILEKKIGDAE